MGITETEKKAIEERLASGSMQFEELVQVVLDLLSRTPIIGYAPYDPEFGDDKVCRCGHTYYRHFDSYEDMSPVGCKYCGCDHYEQ